jgi:hypothetical protein
VREFGRMVGEEEWQEKSVWHRNGRRSWEQQGIIAFYIFQWNEWMGEWHYAIIFVLFDTEDVAAVLLDVRWGLHDVTGAARSTCLYRQYWPTHIDWPLIECHCYMFG